MSAVTMAPPEEQFFDAARYQNVSKDEQAPRVIVFMGDVISPERKRELAHLAAGGDEHPAKTLAVTKGFIRTCRLVPLVPWVEQLSQDDMPGRQPGLTLVRDEQAGRKVEPGSLVSVKQMTGYPRYPGQDIVTILQHDVAQELRTGKVEVEAMRGADYNDAEFGHLQSLFFPTVASVQIQGQGALAEKRPLPLKARAEKVLAVLNEHGEASTPGRIAAAMLESCNIFRLWAERRLEFENHLIRAALAGGSQYVHTYSGLAKTLMQLLEIEPIADAQVGAARNNRDQAEALDRLGEKLAASNVNTETVALVVEEMRLQREQSLAEMTALREQNQQLIDMLMKKEFGQPAEEAKPPVKQPKPR